jgi:F0F1-type ATP synthase membrane subunit a
MKTSAYQSFDRSTQVVSALGALIACITLALFVFTGYIVYQVYVKGVLRIESPEEASPHKESQWIEEER